jgi:hypothetical protein
VTRPRASPTFTRVAPISVALRYTAIEVPVFMTPALAGGLSMRALIVYFPDEETRVAINVAEGASRLEYEAQRAKLEAHVRTHFRAHRFKRYRSDGFPLCPRCGEDELASARMNATADAWARTWSTHYGTLLYEPPTMAECLEDAFSCYRCGWPRER